MAVLEVRDFLPWRLACVTTFRSILVAGRVYPPFHIEDAFVLVVYMFDVSDHKRAASLLQRINLVQRMPNHTLTEFSKFLLRLGTFTITLAKGLVKIAFISNKSCETLDFILIIACSSNDAYINHN